MTTIDPNSPIHVFKTEQVLGRALVVYRECAEAVYSHGGPVLPTVFPMGAWHCANCGDRGILQFDFLTDQTRFMPSKKFHWFEGHYYQYETRQWGCPICKPDARQTLISATLSNSGLNPEDYDIDPAKFLRNEEKCDAIQAGLTVLSTLPRISGFVTIFGGLGVGKTSLGKGIVAKACRAGMPAKYIEAESILIEIRNTFGKNEGPGVADIIAKYMSAPLLVVDELAVGNESDWAIGQLRVILNRRYERRAVQATLMLTNATPDTLRSQWAYMESRMRDGVRVVMGGEDLRGTQQVREMRLPYKDDDNAE